MWIKTYRYFENPFDELTVRLKSLFSKAASHTRRLGARMVLTQGFDPMSTIP